MIFESYSWRSSFLSLNFVSSIPFLLFFLLPIPAQFNCTAPVPNCSVVSAKILFLRHESFVRGFLSFYRNVHWNHSRILSVSTQSLHMLSILNSTQHKWPSQFYYKDARRSLKFLLAQHPIHYIILRWNCIQERISEFCAASIL